MRFTLTTALPSSPSTWIGKLTDRLVVHHDATPTDTPSDYAGPRNAGEHAGQGQDHGRRIQEVGRLSATTRSSVMVVELEPPF